MTRFLYFDLDSLKANRIRFIFLGVLVLSTLWITGCSDVSNLKVINKMDSSEKIVHEALEARSAGDIDRFSRTTIDGHQESIWVNLSDCREADTSKYTFKFLKDGTDEITQPVVSVFYDEILAGYIIVEINNDNWYLSEVAYDFRCPDGVSEGHYPTPEAGGVLTVRYTKVGFVPRNSAIDGNQFTKIRWINETDHAITLTSKFDLYPEISAGILLNPGESFETEITHSKMWPFIEKEKESFGSVFVSP